MKITKIISVSILAFLLGACTASKKITVDNYQTLETPPNGVKISESLFCDQTEITNISWIEYMSWKRKVFGPNSKEYISILPDTSVWLKADVCLEAHTALYFNHPAYNNFPLVGVSQEQAEEYSKWRSDRVFEALLIKYKIIANDPNQTKDQYFTIEKFFNGEMKNVISDKKIMYYPNFRLPTSAERKIILAYSDSLDKAYFDNCKSKYCAGCKDNLPEMWTDVVPCTSDSISPEPTRNVHSGCSSKKGNPIYNLRGNVGEWLVEANTAAGGGWKNKREEILKSDTFQYDESNAWTGFRNVFEWKKWGE